MDAGDAYESSNDESPILSPVNSKQVSKEEDIFDENGQNENEATVLRNILLGSLCVALSQLFFSGNDVFVKLSNLPESQLLIGRFSLQLLFATIWWNVKQPLNTINWYGDKPHIGNIWLRGILYAVSTSCMWYSIIRLPLADAICLYYQSPFIIAILARIMLKEELPNLFPIIIICAIIGVLFISQPTFLVSLWTTMGINIDDSEPLNVDGLIAMVINVSFYSVTPILVRKAIKAHWLQLEMAMSLQMCVIILPIVMTLNHFIFNNVTYGDWSDWKYDFWSILYIFIITINGFAAISLNVIGYQYGDATKVSWLEYSSLLLSVLYQIIIFNDIPNTFEVIGVLFVSIATMLNVAVDLYKYYKIKKTQQYEPVNQLSSATEMSELDGDDEPQRADVIIT